MINTFCKWISLRSMCVIRKSRSLSCAGTWPVCCAGRVPAEQAFTRGGYERIAPAVIQPAGLFLDVVGESLRARTYVFTDPDGAELCLRPDLTVPTCRLHLERHAQPNTPARYCYSGSAF